MQIEDCGGAYKNFLVLGVQTNVGQTKVITHWKARVWAPESAKSYTITELRHTDYHGKSAAEETGFATITVEYFTTKHEGRSKFPQRHKGKHRDEPYPKKNLRRDLKCQ